VRKSFGRRWRIVGRVAGDGFVGELVDAVVAPLQRASSRLSCFIQLGGPGAVASEAERVIVFRNGRRGELGKAIQLVVGEGGR